MKKVNFCKFLVLFFVLFFGMRCFADYSPGSFIYPGCESLNINCGFSVGTDSTIAFIGDSWSAGNHFVQPFYYYINHKFPFSGAGYIPLDSYANNWVLNYYSKDPQFAYYLDPTSTQYNVTRTTVGTWTDTIRGKGPNLMHTNSTDTSTPAQKTIMCTGTDFTIYYLKQSGGGSFSYSIDAGESTPISTVNASNALGIINIPDQTLSAHTLSFTVTGAGTSGVTLFGVDCSIRNSGGIKIHKLGLSGASAVHWASVTASLWQSEIASLNPDIVVINLGTNDITSKSVNQYTADMTTLINNLKTALPNVKIILMPPVIGTRTGPAGDVSAYYPALQGLALQNGYGYLEADKFFGSYQVANAQGLWFDGVHLTTAGDQMFSDILVDYLGLTDVPIISSITGENPQPHIGGELITINGSYFVSKSTVTIGGHSANTSYVSPEKLTVIAPSNEADVADITVTNYIQNINCTNCMQYANRAAVLPAMVYQKPILPNGDFVIQINNSAPHTNNRKVNLKTNAGPDIKKIAISMTGDFTDSAQQDYTPSIEWDLCSSFAGKIEKTDCPSGTYTVYAKFYTEYGQSSDTTSSSIFLNGGSIKKGSTNYSQSSMGSLTKYLKFNQSDLQVKFLQMFLNTDPDTIVAKIGPGSPGHETQFFGYSTKLAVIKFQEKYRKDILTPLGLVKGTGLVSRNTLLKINYLLTKNEVIN